MFELDGTSPTLSSFALDMQAINTSNTKYYSFIDFVRFRIRRLLRGSSDGLCVYNLAPKRKIPFIGNWRKNVLKLLREAFCIANSSRIIPELQKCSKKDLINRVTHSEHLQELLTQSDDRKGRATSIYSSLQHMCQTNANGDDVSWQEVQDVVFPVEDVNRRPIFRHSPLSVSIYSNDSTTKASAVHEMEVDIVTHRVYLLMLSGELHVWDAATLGTKPCLACPVVMRECSPADIGNQDGSVTGYRSMHRCMDDLKIIESMFMMMPRVKILQVCSRSRVLIVNSTLGDRCLRVFEPLSLRRLYRTRLDLPCSPWFALGLFDEEEENIPIWSKSSVEQQRHLPRHTTHWSSACSVLNFCYLAEQEVAVCIISERRTILAYCFVTGLALGSFPGHTASPSCILYIPSQEHIVTGGTDKSIRVWDLESSFLLSLERKWLPIKRKFMPQATSTLNDVASSVVDIAQHAEHPIYCDNRHKQHNPESTTHQVCPEFDVLMMLREALLKNYERYSEQWRIGRVTSVIDYAEVWPSASGGKAIPFHTMSDRKHVLEILMEDTDEVIILDPNLNDIQVLSDEKQTSMTDPQQHFGECRSPFFKVGTHVTLWWKKAIKACGRDELAYLACKTLFEGYESTCTVNDFMSTVLTLDGAPSEAQLLSILKIFIEVKGNRKSILLSKVFRCMKNFSLLALSTPSLITDYQSIRDAHLAIREVVSCKCQLLGHSDPVTSLTYLPVSMLLASGDSKGKVRLWDPCSSRIALSRRDPISDLPSEMTTSVKPFDCVLKMNVPTTNSEEHDSGCGDGVRSQRIRLLFPLVLHSDDLTASCSILCPTSAEDSAKLLDKRQDILSRAFFYLLDGDEIITTEIQHFNRNLVLLDSTSFSEVRFKAN